MNIALQTTSLAPSGGIERTTLQLGRALAARGHLVDVVGMAPGSFSDDYESFARSVHVPGVFSHGPFHVGQLREVSATVRWLNSFVPAVRAARRLRPDVVYAHMLTALPWALAVSAARPTGVVCHLHAVCERDISRQARRWARSVRSFIVPSEAARRSWMVHGLPEPLVVPDGVDPDEYPPTDENGRSRARRSLGLGAESFVVLFYGRIEESKGLNVLLGAWHRLGRLRRSAELLLVGPAPDRFAPWIRGQPGIRHLPMRHDVLTPLHAADLVVVPSLHPESFGRVVVEAMAVGCPVVASRIGALPEILTGRFEECLCPPGNEDALAERIESFSGWRARDPSLAEACTRHVVERFGLARMVDRVEAILAEAR